MINYESLLKSRSYSDGSFHYWNPQPISSPSKYFLFGDDSMPVDPAWGAHQAIEKLIALGLLLELPVGQWVMDGRKNYKEFENVPDVAMELLKSNIKDEAAHELGFRYMAAGYPVREEISREAKLIAETWFSAPGHLLERAAIAETGVFLVSLGLMRLAGGKDLAGMAEQISKDESRHVTTNRSVLLDMGLKPGNPCEGLRSVVKDTLSWVGEGLSIPGDELGENFDFNTDFMIGESDSLIENGVAVRLDSLMNFGVWNAPFEISNVKMYDRIGEVA